LHELITFTQVFNESIQNFHPDWNMDLNKYKPQGIKQLNKIKYYLLICFLLEVQNNTPAKITVITFNLQNIKIVMVDRDQKDISISLDFTTK